MVILTGSPIPTLEIRRVGQVMVGYPHDSISYREGNHNIQWGYLGVKNITFIYCMILSQHQQSLNAP